MAGVDRAGALNAGHAADIRRYVGPALDDDELRTLKSLCDKLRLAQSSISD